MTIKRIYQRCLFYPTKWVVDSTEYFIPKLRLKMLRILFRSMGMHIGILGYVHRTAKFDDFNKISIGNNVVISFGVYFLTHDWSRHIAYNTLPSTPPIT